VVGLCLIQDGRFRYVNPKLAAIFGYSTEELLALESVLDLLAEENPPGTRDSLRKRLEEDPQAAPFIFTAVRGTGERIDVEAHAMHVRRAHQVGRRQAQADPGIDQGDEAGALGRGGLECQPRLDVVDGEPQRLQHEERRLVARIGRAVTVGEPRRAETPLRKPEEIAEGGERGFVGGRHTGLD